MPQKYPVAEKPAFILEKGQVYIMEVHSPLDSFLNFTYSYSVGGQTTNVTSPLQVVEKDFSTYEKYLVISDPIPPHGQPPETAAESTGANYSIAQSGASYTITMARRYSWTQKVYNLRSRQEVEVALNPENWISGLAQRWHMVSEDGEVSKEFVSHEEPEEEAKPEEEGCLDPKPLLTKSLKDIASNHLLLHSAGFSGGTSNNLSFFPPMILEEEEEEEDQPKKKKKKKSKKTPKSKKAAIKKTAKKAATAKKAKTRSAGSSKK